MKENLKPCAYKLRERHKDCNRVLFVERSGELRVPARLSAESTEPQGGRALRGRQSARAGPKPGDLPVPRLKTP